MKRQKVSYGFGTGSRIIEHLPVAQTVNGDIPPIAEPRVYISQMILKCRGHHVVALKIGLSAAPEHFILRGEYFRQRPLHENDLIIAPFGDRQEKLGDDLDYLTLGFVNKVRLLGQVLGRFPFAITPWVVGVRLTFIVSKERHAAWIQ